MSVLDHVNLHFVDSFSEAEEFMRWLGERRKVMGVDTETGGFSPERNRLRLVQFGDLNDGWAFPWERWSGLALEVLKKYEEPLVLHNSKFDARFLSLHGKFMWPWHLTNDTMCMAHLLDPLRSKGLKPLSAQLIDPKAAAAQRLLDEAMTKNKWTWDTVPEAFPYYWVYAAMDPVLTCHLYEKFEGQVNNSYKQVYDLEMAVTRIVAAMERRGVRVDLEYSERKMRELVTWSNQARDWMRETYGIDNPTPARLIRFFEREGVELPPKQTKGGQQSMDKEVLELIKHIVAEYVLAIRKAEKMAGSYFSNFLEFADADGIIHPNIWTMGTRTARMSIQDPALQTLPRRDPLVRSAFVPRKGNGYITCDYDQIEGRLAAHFSNDPGLIAAFLKDEDFFCTIAEEIFGHPVMKGTDERDLTKNVFYGKLFGAGTEKMANTAHVPFHVMDRVHAGFDQRFPGIRTLQRSIGNLAKQRLNADGEAWITTPLGRRLIADDSKEYTLTNYLIQCHAAEILKRAMVELDAALPNVCDEAFMALPVHDELICESPMQVIGEVQMLIEEVMSDMSGYKVPITASSDMLTKSWGEKYEKKAA
jgi:DNA polymerase-1